ncbi:hypothetical protein [Catenuloplanes indicus]|uniref:Uncharacterized protein n=1 Tax=Catenuloplanes indicus TaxID=137267 RepID=A0AAE3VXG0_9ACTN|nr:hypothetical protein [Catenuloplanes indicus]MDQ0364810.1 hypothetical protein [Catenuloplanes indicus]
MPIAMLGRTAVIGLYLIALLATPGPAAVAPAALLGVVWLAAGARDASRAAGFVRVAGAARNTGRAAGPTRNIGRAGAGDGR